MSNSKLKVLEEKYAQIREHTVPHLIRVPQDIIALDNITLKGLTVPEGDEVTVSFKKGKKFNVNQFNYSIGGLMDFGTVVNNKMILFTIPVPPGQDVPEGFKLHSYRWARQSEHGMGWIPVGKETVRKWKAIQKEIDTGSEKAGANLDFEESFTPVDNETAHDALLGYAKGLVGISSKHIQKIITDPDFLNWYNDRYRRGKDRYQNWLEWYDDELEPTYEDMVKSHKRTQYNAYPAAKYTIFSSLRDMYAGYIEELIERGNAEAGANLDF